MTKLFQILADANILCDSSNDDLQNADNGFRWVVPVVKPLPSQLIHLVARAYVRLGDQFRGFELHKSEEPWQPEPPPSATFDYELVLFLTADYDYITDE